jgi:ribosomal protein S18 acetylase RimI-like enzyme
MQPVQIERVQLVDDSLVEAFTRLIPQLSRSAPLPKHAELAALIASPDAVLLVARDDARAIVGTLTLTLYRIPTGMMARIDDVVVDDAARGRGIAEALSRDAIDRARSAGARSVTLTSRPDREAANRLYVRLGFQRLETNVYRFPL